MNQRTLDFHFDIKSVEKNGTIEGYGSVFNVKDHDGEIVAPGAFTESLDWYRDKGLKVPMLWMHQSYEPLGAWDEAKEDGHGLFLRGKMLIEEVPAAREKHALAEAGALSGLSIGFRTQKSRNDLERNAVVIEKLRLWEVSLVTFPANDDARVTAVKAGCPLPTEREFEESLREAGYSKSMAMQIIAKGYRAVLHGEHAQDPGLAELKRALQNLSQTVSR